MAKKLSIFLFLVVVFSAGCGNSERNTLEEITLAYEKAVNDGQYETHLDKFIYPGVSKITDENAFLKNWDKVDMQEGKKEISHELRDMTSREMESLKGYFEFPIKPTHVIDFKIVGVRNSGEKITTTKPLFVTKTEKSWYVVPGIMKKEEEILMNYQEESLEFYQDDGLWRHHWELQFDLDSDFNYEIVLQHPGENARDMVILEKEDVKFFDDRKIIRFHLMPEGRDEIFDSNYDDNIMIPYAYQAGSRSVSSSLTIPAGDQIVYKPNRDPEFTGNELEIARIETTAGSEEKYYEIKLLRTFKPLDKSP